LRINAEAIISEFTLLRTPTCMILSSRPNALTTRLYIKYCTLMKFSEALLAPRKQLFLERLLSLSLLTSNTKSSNKKKLSIRKKKNKIT